MKVKMPSLRRPKYGLAALLLGLTAVLPYFVSNTAYADQLTTRSIKMSTSAAGATSATYEVTFTTSAAIQSLVIDFCRDSPIVGVSCDTSNAGGNFLSAASATLSTPGDLTGWTITPAAHTVKLTGSSVSAGEVTFALGGITNPAYVGTFFARAYTYTDTSYGGYLSPTSLGSTSDIGGFALSTANQVSVSGTVQETLTFCVSGIDLSAVNCSSATTPTLELGHGTPKALDDQVVDTAAAYSQVSTNAGGGIAIRMRNSNSCGGLSKDNGTTCQIAPAGSTLATLAAGDGKFGMRVATDDVSLDPHATYNSSTQYGMDTTAVTSPYGGVVASSTGVLDQVNSTYTFAATAASTTPAGIYTATMTFIATGTY